MGSILGNEDETPLREGASITDGQKTPTAWQRIRNFFVENGRGVIGSIPILVLMIMLLAAPGELRTQPEKTVLFIYLMMLSCLLFHPVKVGAVAFVPVFMFPLLHVIDSNTTSRTYFCANTALLVVGGYLNQLLNVSGWDKRFATWLIFGRGPIEVTNMGLLVKSSLAAYVLAFISSRQHTTKYVMEIVVGSMATEGAENTGLKKAILAHAISSSSTIGSLGIVIGAKNVMFMRSLWEMSGHPDTFNFLDYFLFALPVTLAMFVFNLVYNIIMIKIVVKMEMDHVELEIFEGRVRRHRNAIPEGLTSHEILTLVFAFLSLILYFTRWSKTMHRIAGNRGWADFKGALDEKGNTKIPDVTIAAIMLIICCIFPSTFNFAKLWTAKTVSDLPPEKPDLAIVFWKVVDKNTNYGYMFLVGGFCALDSGVRKTKFADSFLYDQFSWITESSLPVSVLIWCFITGVASNLMTSVGASGMLTILALNAYAPDNELLKKHYQFVLATGMASGMGYFTYFKYTPMYHVRTIAKVSTLSQLQYNSGSILICITVLWAGIYLYAPIIFE